MLRRLPLVALLAACAGDAPPAEDDTAEADTGGAADTAADTADDTDLDTAVSPCQEVAEDVALDDTSLGFGAADLAALLEAAAIREVVWDVRTPGVATESMSVTCDATPTRVQVRTYTWTGEGDATDCPAEPELIANFDCALDVGGGGMVGAGWLSMGGASLDAAVVAAAAPVALDATHAAAAVDCTSAEMVVLGPVATAAVMVVVEGTGACDGSTIAWEGHWRGP